MRKIKNQNGAISLFVLLAMLFFLAFMLGAFTLVTRRNATQVEALKETQAIYKSGASASDVYDSILVSSDSVIPISTKEQLAKIVEIHEGTVVEANYLIDEKLYTYTKDANYVLQNDIILNLETEIDGKNNIDIYDYMLYSDDYNIDANGYDIYYAQNDGSIWKCIAYQNIGTTASPNLFSTEVENEFYYGKSYVANRYSILENGVDAYKKAWDDNTNFEFMLMYNWYDKKFDVSKYNRWRQTNNPAKENIADGNQGTTVAGYTIDFTGGTTALGTETHWGGLARSSRDNAYLDGSIGHQDWYFAVGATSFWQSGGIPVSYLETKESYATENLLFVRVK